MKYINQNAISPYIPYVCFHHKANKFLNKNFIIPRINAFFEEKISSGYILLELDRDFLVSDVDWTVDHLYTFLFKDLQKDEYGKIRPQIKYSITFDEDLAPHESTIMCPATNTNIRFGTIKLGDEPIFYLSLYTSPGPPGS